MSSVLNNVPQTNGRPNGLQSPRGVERRTLQCWAVGKDKIVEEREQGRYTITDCACLDLQGLRRVHAVLGCVLSDLAADTSVNDEFQPPF